MSRTRRFAQVALAVGLSLVAPTTVLAQGGDSGQIVGYVFDQTGSPLGGVKVTASSDTQIGGKKTAYTNEEGRFRFPQLIPGRFQVKVEAPRLQTVVQENIPVGINSPAEVNLVMEVQASKVEEVKVVEKAPVVSTTTANVKETFDVDMVDAMPHENRDVIFQQVTNYVAGAIRGGRVRGGGGNQTIYMMDGFDMLNQFPTVKANAAYEIQTAAYGAENANAPGGVVNLVSRSGSNKFEFELGGTYDHSNLRFFEDEGDPVTPSHFYVLNPTIAGPIIKDKLWYSANVEFLHRQTGRDPDVDGILPDPLPELRYWYKGTITLAWQVTARSKLRSVTNFDEFWRVNTEGLGTDASAQGRTFQHKYFTGLIWESLLTDWMVFRSQASLIGTTNDIRPVSCFESPDTCDHTPSILQRFPRNYRYGNRNGRTAGNGYAIQLVNRLETFLSSKTLGEHHLQLKDNVLTRWNIDRRSVPGDQQYELNGTVPDALVDYFSNDPRIEPERRGWFITSSSAMRNILSLSDTWRPTRHLTVTPGLAHTYAQADNSMAEPVFKGSALSPSLAVAWDATHDGRTALRASVNQYVDADVNAIATHTLGSQVQRRCRWNAATGDYDLNCEYSGGASASTVGMPCGPTGIDAAGRPCRQKLVLPKTWEYTAGAEREVVEGVSMGLDGIYRKYTNQFERLETNRVWNTSGMGLDQAGGYRNGRPTTVSDLETPDNAYRRYVGVTASLAKREGNFKLRASYTWSKLNGTVLTGNDNRLGDVSASDLFLDGYLGDDHRHEIKANATYRFTRWLSMGLRYQYYSGLPYSRVYRNPVTGEYDTYRATVGVNPGNNINDPNDDRELRLPDLQSVNAQLSFNLLPLISQNIEAYVDVLNVLGLRTVTEVAENDNTDFGVVRGRQEPLRVRLGFRYKY
jgi:Carboxypeptidase regulatory-like domain